MNLQILYFNRDSEMCDKNQTMEPQRLRSLSDFVHINYDQLKLTSDDVRTSFAKAAESLVQLKYKEPAIFKCVMAFLAENQHSKDFAILIKELMEKLRNLSSGVSSSPRFSSPPMSESLIPFVRITYRTHDATTVITTLDFY